MSDWSVLYVDDAVPAPSTGEFTDEAGRIVAWEHVNVGNPLTGPYDVIQVQTATRPTDAQLDELRAALRVPGSVFLVLS